MRADGVGVRTWVLAAIAGWALLIWALAIFGMGGRIQPLPADSALAPALPPVPPTSRLASHDAGEYGEATTRPLFFSDRRPKPFTLQPGGDEAKQNTFDYVLSGVLITPVLRMAILQPPDPNADSIRLKLGEDSEKLPGWQLTEVTPRSATFASGSETRTLDLPVFDGTTGLPPTAQPSVSPARGATQATMPVPSQSPVQVPNATNKQPMPASTAAGQDAASPVPEQGVGSPSSNEAQLQAIRQRIEARRAKLREEAQQAAKPKN